MNRQSSDPMAAKATSAAAVICKTPPPSPMGVSGVKERLTTGKGQKKTSKSPKKEGKSVKVKSGGSAARGASVDPHRPKSCLRPAPMLDLRGNEKAKVGASIPEGRLIGGILSLGVDNRNSSLENRATNFGSSGVSGTSSHTTTLLEKNKATYGGKATTSSKLAKQSLPEVASTLPTDSVNKVGKGAGTGEGLEKVVLVGEGGKSRRNSSAARSTKSVAGGSPRGRTAASIFATGSMKTSPSRVKSTRRGKSASPSSGKSTSNKSRKQTRSVIKISLRGKAGDGSVVAGAAKSNKQKSRTEAKSRR